MPLLITPAHLTQMGRDERRRPESRLASTIEFAGRSRASLSPVSDPDDGDDPVYNRRHRSRRSPRSETPPRRSPTPDRPRRWSPYHDRGYRNGKLSAIGDRGSDSDDEDLKGLSYFEHRRLKRQKLRKKLKNCIWRVTPSPPPGEREQSEPLDEPNGSMDPPAEEQDEANEKKSGKDRRGRSESDDSDLSASESASEGSGCDSDSPPRKRGRGRTSRRRRTGRKRRYSDSSEDDSENSSYEDSSAGSESSYDSLSDDEDRKKSKRRS